MAVDIKCPFCGGITSGLFCKYCGFEIHILPEGVSDEIKAYEQERITKFGERLEEIARLKSELKVQTSSSKNEIEKIRRDAKMKAQSDQSKINHLTKVLDDANNKTMELESQKRHLETLKNQMEKTHKTEIKQLTKDLEQRNKGLAEATRMIILLLFTLLGCDIGFFFLNDNYKRTYKELTEKIDTLKIFENKNSILERSIKGLQLDRSVLTEKNETLKGLENEISILKESLPFIVYKTEFKWSRGWLKFYYYGIEPLSNIELKVKAFPNDSEEHSFSNSSTFIIKQGFNSDSIYLSSSLKSSKWYSFELLLDKKIVGGDRH